MRRRPGISGLQRDLATRGVYKAVGEHVTQNTAEQVKAQLQTFRKSLEEFALKHRDDIRRNPAFRAQFHTMCANIGVDPLASNKGMWAQLLGLGDFYYQLGVQVIEACVRTREHNGGLIELGKLRSLVQQRRGSVAEPITSDDVLRAVDKLKVLGGGYMAVGIGSLTYIRSVPRELNLDGNKVLEVAQARGCVSARQLCHAAGWQELRAKDVLSGLLRDGMCMIDYGDPSGEPLFWFPCLDVQGLQEATSLAV